MPLSDKDLERIRRHLHAAGIEMPCPACGSPEVTIDPVPAAMLRVEGRTLELDNGQAVRAITVICQRCGFIRLHSAAVLGIN